MRFLPALPSFLQRRHTDEFTPAPYSLRDRELISRVADAGPRSAKRTARALADYWSGRTGSAAGLLEINAAAGQVYYEVPPEAAEDDAAANEALGGEELVIDVQTHFVSDRREAAWSS